MYATPILNAQIAYVQFEDRQVVESETHIFQVCNVEKIANILTNAKSEDIIVFDVDEVLIAGKDRFLRSKNAESICYTIFSEIFEPLDDLKKLNYMESG